MPQLSLFYSPNKVALSGPEAKYTIAYDMYMGLSLESQLESRIVSPFVNFNSSVNLILRKSSRVLLEEFDHGIWMRYLFWSELRTTPVRTRHSNVLLWL